MLGSACYLPAMFRFRARALAVFFGLASVVSAAALSITTDAPASVSIAVTFDGLVRETSLSAVVTPLEQRSAWENGRIYTFTRVNIDRVLARATPVPASPTTPTEAWVRTMGGIVGKIGQAVDGEAVLTIGRPSLLFLHPGPPGTLEVTARGQGQFPIVVDDKKATRVIRASNVGALLAPRSSATTTNAQTPAPAALPLAADVIHGRLLDDVARDVASAYKRIHATK